MGADHSRDSSYLPVSNHDVILDLGGGTSSGGAPDAAAADAASMLRPRRPRRTLEAFRGKSVRTIRSLATMGGLIDFAGRSLHTVSDWPMQGLGGRGGVSTTTDGDADAIAAAADAAHARSSAMVTANNNNNNNNSDVDGAEDGVGGIDGMEVVGSAMTLLEGRLVIMIYSFLAPEDLLLRCPAVARRWFVLSANDVLWTVRDER